ncbi:hypothetical protein CAP35_00125 [Chitinophagaceae bacterium IBVUCB1]|nr:hypothetical protein CAP35_00125 [Chitinophagaceae bacterium IBVUCB1]
MKIRLLSTLLLAGSITALAQPKLIKDINPLGDSYPGWVTGFGSRVAFFADNGTDGYELWAYDTAANLQYNINPGASSGTWATNHMKMAASGNYLYFPADNGTTGLELYRWNGNNAPELATDVNSGGSSNVTEVYANDGRIYFTANTPANGTELWSYTTNSGYTQRLTDIVTGSGSSNPYGYIAFKDKIYFGATATTTGAELYSYNPVNNTVSIAFDINTGLGGSSPQGFMVANNKLYFSAYTPAFGRELYVFDGTNIQRLTNIDNSGLDGVVTVSPGQTQFIWYNNKIYFAGDDGVSGSHLYEYNPGNGVAMKVFNINPGGASNPQNFTYYAGKIFFSADDGTHGEELWMFNGKTSPTMVADLDTTVGSSPMNMLRWGTKLYFSAFTLPTGSELYVLSDSAALGIQHISFDAAVTAFPNPTTGDANIKLTLGKDAQIAYTITDISGRLIQNGAATTYAKGEHMININLQSVPAGTYIYKLQGADGNMLATGKIQKQ